MGYTIDHCNSCGSHLSISSIGEKKQKKIADIEKKAYESYLTEKKLEQVLEDIGKGPDQYYFQLCFCHCCKVSAYDIDSIKSKVAIKLYLMLKETIGWKEKSNDMYRLDEKKKKSFALALSIDDKILSKMIKMSIDHRLSMTEELKKDYFPEISKRRKKKKRKVIDRNNKKFTALSKIKEGTSDNANEHESLTGEYKSDKERKEHTCISTKTYNEY